MSATTIAPEKQARVDVAIITFITENSGSEASAEYLLSLSQERRRAVAEILAPAITMAVSLLDALGKEAPAADVYDLTDEQAASVEKRLGPKEPATPKEVSFKIVDVYVRPIPTITEGKVCTKCGGDPQPLENFAKNKARKDGLHMWCKRCMGEYAKARSLRSAKPRRAPHHKPDEPKRTTANYSKIAAKAPTTQPAEGERVKRVCACGREFRTTSRHEDCPICRG